MHRGLLTGATSWRTSAPKRVNPAPIGGIRQYRYGDSKPGFRTEELALEQDWGRSVIAPPAKADSIDHSSVELGTYFGTRRNQRAICPGGVASSSVEATSRTRS